MYLPESIRKHLSDREYTLDDIGCSDAKVLLYPNAVLKIQPDCDVSANEYFMMRWLQGKLPVPEILAAELVDGKRYLLMRRVQGKYLCDESILDDQHRLAELVAEGLRMLWSVDVADCPTIRTLDEKFKEIETGLKTGLITMEQARQSVTYGA